ncbi:MAG: ACT domain-containing protein, partial [Pseudomonadota bacterium]
DQVIQSIEPCLVPKHSQLGSVEGVFNAVLVEGDFVGAGLSVGRGAGEGPTASAIVADIIDLARGLNVPTFGKPVRELTTPQWADAGETTNRYYIRLNVTDRAGVVAEITAILRDFNISIEAFLQRGRDPDQPVPLVMTTHETRHGDMMKAMKEIEKIEAMVQKPCIMRIEELE